jgi:class 3 adenylate cyclase/tetratricopeptide (TPR) repeat protein
VRDQHARVGGVTLKCPRCQHDNETAAKFCEECATPLARSCSHCGRQLSPTARFCPECAHPTGQAAETPTVAAPFASPKSYTPKHLAEKILTSRAALEGERKQVTVLFADLKGSMELLADRDPEEARRLLDPVLEHMMEAVHRFEGTVNQVMGDGIMALFGAPLAHEDHAVRACYAALRMQESVKRYAEGARREHGVTVRIRVGLNSGEVVVRAIGSDLHMDYTAVGQTTHLAARMEQLAEPGSILLSPATLELAEGYIAVKPLGPLPVKGLPAPVEVCELVGAGAARSRLHAAAARGMTHFVGRDSEVDQLRQAVERAYTGHGQVVAVGGEPGVGKSRLCWEFTHSHRARGWRVLEAGCVPYGTATPYLPVIDLLKAYFRIEGQDGTPAIREQVTETLRSLDRALEPSLPALLWLLEVPVEDEMWERLDPSQRRQRTLDAVKQLLLRESRVQPLMLLVEDLHWIDAESQTFLDNLVESLPTARLVLLATYRPEYQHRWGSKTYYRQLRIDPLAADSADDLLTSLLGTEESLGSLKRALVERTEGNPLFLEESVRALAETKVLVGDRGAYQLVRDATAIQVPATVQAILAARIDRLPAEDKRLLQTAAVIGKDVPFALLLAIADLAEEDLRRGLAHLQAAELLYETSLFPDLEHTFKHALTHEVAYGGLLQARRRELHARIVGAIETLHQERLGGEIERLAHHALRGELRDKAVHYLRQAGLKTAARSALPDARAWFEQALGVLEALPESPSTLEQAFEIRLELRPVLNLLGEGRPLLDCLREAEALAERLNDDRRRGRVCAFMVNVHSVRGELDEALVAGARALEIAGRLGDLELRILSTSYLEQVQYLRGEYERVVELATDNLAALPADWLYKYFERPAPASVFDRFYLVTSLAELGRFAEAAPYHAEAIRLAEATYHPFTISLAHQAGSVLHLLKGNWVQACSLIERWIAVLRAGNVPTNLPGAVASSAWVLAQLGDASEALSRIRGCEQLLERQAARGRGLLGRAYHPLGRACLLLGRLDEARHLGDRALESSRSQPGYAAEALRLLGDIETHPDRFDAERGEAHYRQALALAEPRGMRPLVAHCHLGLGQLCRRMGRPQEALEHLTLATTMYREMDMRFWLEQAAELKELLTSGRT